MPDIVVSVPNSTIEVKPVEQPITVNTDTNEIAVSQVNYQVSVTNTPIQVTIGSDNGGSTISSTDFLSEGGNNLYFTQARARNSISIDDQGGLGSLNYNTATGVITYTGPSANDFQNTLTAGTGIDISNQDVISVDLGDFTTDNLAEGSANKYFTQTLARNSISASTGVTYDAITGSISIGQSVAVNANPTFNSLSFGNNNTSNPRGITGTVSNNDYWFVGGRSAGGTGADDGLLIIATGNNGSEPIHVRQYTGNDTTLPFPGNNTIARQLTLLDSSGNTTLPGSLTGTTANFDSINISNNNTQTIKGMQGTMASNDYWFIGGYDISAGGSNMGAMVIATGNNGDINGAAEPIYVQQYGGGNDTQPFPGTNTAARTLTLLDNFGNTSIPGSISIGNGIIKDGNGVEFIKLTTDGNGTKFIEFGRGLGSGWGIGVFLSGIGFGNEITQTTRKLTTATAGQTYIINSYGIGQKAAKYLIQINTSTKFQMWEGMVIHDGTNVFLNAYGDLRTGDNLATFSVEIVGSSVNLKAVPTYANTTFRLMNTIFGA